MDGGGGEEDNFVDEVVVESKIKEGEEEEMNKCKRQQCR